jgi:hypothetical protein
MGDKESAITKNGSQNAAGGIYKKGVAYEFMLYNNELF